MPENTRLTSLALVEQAQKRAERIVSDRRRMIVELASELDEELKYCVSDAEVDAVLRMFAKAERAIKKGGR